MWLTMLNISSPREYRGKDRSASLIRFAITTPPWMGLIIAKMGQIVTLPPYFATLLAVEWDSTLLIDAVESHCEPF